MKNLKQGSHRNDVVIDTETAQTLLLGLFSVSKRFLVTYRYTNRTDASLHQDEIEVVVEKGQFYVELP